MKLDEHEWRMLIPIVCGLLLGIIVPVLFFLFIGV
jgi:hypothetical protein